jgi:hypothetical protein
LEQILTVQVPLAFGVNESLKVFPWLAFACVTVETAVLLGFTHWMNASPIWFPVIVVMVELAQTVSPRANDADAVVQSLLRTATDAAVTLPSVNVARAVPEIGPVAVTA